MIELFCNKKSSESNFVRKTSTVYLTKCCLSLMYTNFETLFHCVTDANGVTAKHLDTLQIRRTALPLQPVYVTYF